MAAPRLPRRFARVSTKDWNPPDAAVRSGRPERRVCGDNGHSQDRSRAVGFESKRPFIGKSQCFWVRASPPGIAE